MATSKEVSECKQELSLVCPSDIVFSDPGDDVVLSGHLEPAISAASMEIKWWNYDLVCHYKDGRVTVNREYEGRVSLSLEDLHNGNVSLTLRDVRRSQMGLYICEVIQEYQTTRDYVFLHIISESFSLVVRTGSVSARPGSDVILPVHLSPETSAVSLKIRWFKGTELIYQYNNRQEKTNNVYENRAGLSIQELRRGNISFILRNVQQSDSGDYICTVFHNESQKTGTVHLQVRELQKSEKTWEVEQNILRQIHTGNQTPFQNRLDHCEQCSTLERQLIELKRQFSERERDLLVWESQLMERETVLLHTPGPMCRHRRSMEGVLPLMERESGHQNTRQTREESTATWQELLSPDTSSQVLQRERGRVRARVREGMQRTQERIQQFVTRQERSSPARQSQVQERERTSESEVSRGRVRARVREIMQRAQEMSQQSVFTRHQRSSPARQEIERTRDATQTPNRPDDKMQRR